MIDRIHPDQLTDLGERVRTYPVRGGSVITDNRWASWRSQFNSSFVMTRPMTTTRWAKRKKRKGPLPCLCHDNIRLLIARGISRCEGGGNANSQPALTRSLVGDFSRVMSRKRPVKGRPDEPPVIPRSVRFDAPSQLCKEQGQAVTHLLSKANNPGWRPGSDHPTERQTYEKGNVDQRIAGGRMPDCDR